METAGGALIVAVVTLGFNVFIHFFGGGWRLSGRLSSMEASMKAMQESVLAAQSEIKKFGEILVKMADMRGEIKVIDTRLTALDQRVTAQDRDISELRHGQGFIRGPGGIDREYVG